MRYFPIFFDLQNRPVTVVGGGEEALRKIRLLLKTGAVINVIAPELHEDLAAERRVNWIARAYQAGLLEGAALVYSAEAALNEQVAADAQALGIPVNAVDNPDISTFIVPSIVSRSIGRVRRRFQAASPAAATTPRATDSLGVAMPA